MRVSLEDQLKKSGVETEIRNLVFHLVRNKFHTESVSPLTQNPSKTQIVVAQKYTPTGETTAIVSSQSSVPTTVGSS